MYDDLETRSRQTFLSSEGIVFSIIEIDPSVDYLNWTGYIDGLG